MDIVKVFMLIALFVDLNLEQRNFVHSLIRLKKISPVILIPGDGGSQIEAKLNKTSVPHYICAKQTTDFFNIWLNLELLVPVVVDCWVDNMRLVYDNETGTTSNAPGVETRVPNFGDAFPVEYLDPSKASAGAYFRDIGNALTTLGYERNVSLRGAPYDFRKAPYENKKWFLDLRNLIEETYAINGESRVVLVGHSMGSLMTLHFLQSMTQSWKDTYIAGFISLAGAFGGSVKAIKVYAVGDDLGTFILRQRTLREMQITSSSLAYLLPSPLFWKPDETLVVTDGGSNYTLSNLQDFFKQLNFFEAWEMRRNSKSYYSNFTAPGVEVHCLHGINVKTVERLVYKKDKFPNGDPVFEYGDGDGTVNRRSLEGCLHWRKTQTQKIYYEVLPNTDHMGILSSKDTINYVLSVLEKL